MGINPTQPNHKAFTFDGTSSRGYGVYITGEAVFNAPQRNVQMVDIPGRNGAYALDKGNFNNITVKYPASIVADNATDFAKAVSDLRNFLCSKTGYCRLEDEYNPDEYRMAVYKSGLEVSHDMLTAGEFDITFECKPQRWLTSGETAVTLVSGNDITNPTLFPSRPQLQVYGYGDIDVGGDVITVDNATIGKIVICNSYTSDVFSNSWNNPHKWVELTLDTSSLNVGDAITMAGYTVISAYDYGASINTATIETSTNVKSVANKIINNTTMQMTAVTNDASFVYGTAAQESSSFVKYKANITGGGSSIAVEVTFYIAYDGADTISFYIGNLSTCQTQFKSPVIIGDSSLSALGHPCYIDLDIGECWNEDSGTPVSINNVVSLPPELPTLPSGNTTITFDNTFTQVDIVPRWWKV